MKNPINVLEFYSGIGGTHCSLKQIGIPITVLAAFEINTSANAVYKHNFPGTLLQQKNIEGLTEDDLDKYSADMWTLSPPCQPFTRLGKQGASEDPRSRSFYNIIDILSVMKKPPAYIFLENVKGFETADTCDDFLSALTARGYFYQSFLISPSDFGFPNSRMRYYLIAKRKESFSFATTLASLSVNQSNSTCDCVSVQPCACKLLQTKLIGCKKLTVKDVFAANGIANLQSFCQNNLLKYRLSNNILLRYGELLDIINLDSCHSCCFTKAYSKFIEGTGSVLTSKTLAEVKEVFKQLKLVSNNDNEKLALLDSLELRFFTPCEILMLMNFPSFFTFPSETSDKQKYKLLGNSINIFVVKNIMKWFLFEI